MLGLNVDTDFAGCRVTRRSTSGGAAVRGNRCVRHWPSTQPTIALSSGEAELGGIPKGPSQGIGLRSIARDLGFDLSLKLRTDATSAIGIARGLGAGKPDIWILHSQRCKAMLEMVALGSKRSRVQRTRVMLVLAC